MKKFGIIIMLLFSMTLANAQTYRYVESTFQNIEKISNIIYGTAPFLNTPYSDEASANQGDLVMDLYHPLGDDIGMRPAIVFAHGGGFATGNRNVDDMVTFCELFAHLGYVAVTIDYRQGVEFLDNGSLHYTRAAYRGLQDGRSAIRFLRANASNYGIDPAKIYWGGNSAGSFIGLNSIYMDSDEKPDFAGTVTYTIGFFNFTGPDLGGLDVGSYLEFSGEPNAVMACWGGVGDTTQVDVRNQQPVLLIHGTSDQIVPFNSGPPFNIAAITDVYGSNAIMQRLTNLIMPTADTYFVTGVGHEFYGVTNGNWTNGVGGNEYWDIIVDKAINFYWRQHKPEAMFSSVSSDLSADFKDESTDATSWWWDFGDGNSSMEANPSHSYLAYGDYQVKLHVQNEIDSWDSVSMQVTISPITGIEPSNKESLAVYPNPTKGSLWVLAGQNPAIEEIQVFNISGKELINKKMEGASMCELDLSGYQPGIYFVHIITFEKMKIIKLIKN